MPERTRDGVRIAYSETGRGEPPLVFVHGWCCDRSHFQPQYDHFAARHRVVALDQRGFGESDRPEQAYTIEGFADDLAWLCRELELASPVIVGHSLGGAVAVATAARHPELARGLVLCDPAILWPEPVLANLSGLVEALASPGYLEAIRGFISEALFIDADDPARKQRIMDGMMQTPQRVMHSAFRELAAFDSDSALAACKVPVLLIDAEVAIPDRTRASELCPSLLRAQTAGAGHFHQLEVPEQVNAMIDAFLERKLQESP